MSKPLGKKIDPTTRTLLEQPYSLPSCGRGGARHAVHPVARHDGYVANEFGTIIEIAESPVMPGVYWVGTNDGNVQVSRDGGLTWTEVGKNLPGGTHEYHVSGLEASWYDAGTAYVALDGHYATTTSKPYVFKTTDYGQTWTAISGNLPTRQRELDPAGSGEPQPALRADRVRLLHLARTTAARGTRSCRTCRRAASTRCSCTRATTI